MQARSIVLPILACSLAFTTHRGDAQQPTSLAHRTSTARQVPLAERRDALARAQVWTAPTVPVSKARLGAHPAQPAALECKFLMTEPSGTSSKFDCALPTGEEIRVKYGNTPEIPSEIAATRLLQALGFGADDVTLMERVRCYGCPSQPFPTMKAVDIGNAATLYEKLIDYSRYREFNWVSVERKHPGPAITTDAIKGWAFFELETIDVGRGGAPRAHVDALRLLAVFLAHWDNKSENQRLVCASPRDWPDDGPCTKPVAILQDVGALFGPPKVELAAWKRTAIWKDRATCMVSMETLPSGGGTFAPVSISEAGRRLLASLLAQLSDAQLHELFTAARFDKLKGFLPVRQNAIADWVQVFEAKVREVSDGPPCPQ